MAKDAGAKERPPILTRANLKAFLLVNLGVLLLTTGVYFFKLPNNFSTGGVSGISIILGSLIPGISTATLMAVINILLLVLGYLFLGRQFGFWTTYCSLMYSFETWALERLFPMNGPFTNQPLLELCFAMMLPAVGSALMFNYNASSGGTDIVAMILKKYTGNTFKTHLNQVRVSKAFRDLLETDYSVLEIAMRNGFSDTRSLINVFRDTYGMTPSQYRKKNARREAAKEAASAEYPPHIRVVDAP